LNKIAVFLIVLTALLWAASSRAQGWDASLPEHPSLPAKFLAIDKNDQRLLIFAKRSPLKVLNDLTCTTGQVPGDKLVRGDLKTPEGVYFVVRRLSGGLDYDLYGNLAFTLNFPNPVDRLKGKTGSGIWIHGRGKPVVPRETKGCVALHLPDLQGIENQLEPGTPVTIARSVSWTRDGGDGNADIQELVRQVHNWAKAWQNKSDDFFASYDSARFAKSQRQPFAAFKNHKKRIFKAQDWIQVMAHDVRVVPGPDYWVTYFDQFYRTPSLMSQGVKRLYWMKDQNGQFRIVGREWFRRPVSLTGEYLARARSEVAPLVMGWGEAWQSANIDQYAKYYARDIHQDGRTGIREVKEYKRDLWRRSKPKTVDIDDIRVDLAPEGVAATFRQRYVAQNGYSDLGLKTLVLEPGPDGWKIVREAWRPL
jgi:murein L,D-transpeptidase YafK